MSDDPYRDGFLCCAEGAMPLTEIRALLYAQAAAYARAAGMLDPAVYARWVLAQVGMADVPRETSRDAQTAQVMADAYSSQAAYN